MTADARPMSSFRLKPASRAVAPISARSPCDLRVISLGLEPARRAVAAIHDAARRSTHSVPPLPPSLPPAHCVAFEVYSLESNLEGEWVEGLTNSTSKLPRAIHLARMRDGGGD